MQQPTLQNVRIRSTRDALQVFNGVAMNRLPLVTHRLDAEERRAIAPGNVYVWEERGANTEPTGVGMERWTDGMGWGPSRVRDEFLFYHQKESDTSDDLLSPVTPWAQMMRKREVISRLPGSSYPSTRASQPSNSAERLVKQTYSVHVSLPADRPRSIIRKWHLTAYFSQRKLDALDTVDNIPGIGDVVVPDGWFRSARAGKTPRDNRKFTCDPQRSSEDVLYSPSNFERTHEISSSPHRHSRSSQIHTSVSSTPSDKSTSVSPSSSTSLGSRYPCGSQTLVPLQYLQSVSGVRRNPIDEQFLKMFSTQATSSSGSLRSP